jgi:hypothetical protein
MESDAQKYIEEALGYVLWFGITEGISIVVGLTASLLTFRYIPIFTPSELNTTNPKYAATVISPLISSISRNFFSLSPLVFLQVAPFSLLFLAFLKLSKHNSSFRFVYLFTIVQILSLIVTFLLFLFILDEFSSTINGVASGTFSLGDASYIIKNRILPTLLLLALCGIITIVGIICGEVLGLWRLGKMLDMLTFKIAALFAVIPFLSIATPFLCIAGYYTLKK